MGTKFSTYFNITFEKWVTASFLYSFIIQFVKLNGIYNSTLNVHFEVHFQ